MVLLVCLSRSLSPSLKGVSVGACAGVVVVNVVVDGGVCGGGGGVSTERRTSSRHVGRQTRGGG